MMFSPSFSSLMVELPATEPKVGSSSHTIVSLIILVDSGVSKTLRGKIFEIFTYQPANRWQFNMDCMLKIK